MQEEISFGIWLRKQRHALDLTRQAFADQVGCAEVTLRRIEAGTLKPSKELANLLLEKLGTPEGERSRWISFARGRSGFPSQPFPPLNKPKSNLPTPLTTFIGREKEQLDIIQLITKHRLVTLTGSGGVGKTRLSIKIGEQILENYPDGVWLAELAPILDPLLVPRTTAIAIGLRDEPQRPVIEMLCDYLCEKSMLIILDNCEHLLESCSQMVDRVLRAAPNVHILATSRESLGVDGELTYRVPSLGLPDLNNLPPTESLSQYEAVQLFIDRATSAVPALTVSKDNAPLLAQICARMEGIPLAIELAAAKVRVLSIEQIAERLDDRFSLLTSGNRAALPRYQTLRATIDWSYNLLSLVEQILFRRLSAFVGGWTLKAAESVCIDESVKREDILNLMEKLVNKSLVITEESHHELRYGMLETLRQYAHEKLVESGETDPLQDKHLEFYLNLAETAEPHIIRPEQVEWLPVLEADYENIRVALEWALSKESPEPSQNFCVDLHWFWKVRGYWLEGLNWLERALAKSSQNESKNEKLVRARALAVHTSLKMQLGIAEGALASAQASLVLALEVSDKKAVAIAKFYTGVALRGADDEQAHSFLEQSFAEFQELNEVFWQAYCFFWLSFFLGAPKFKSRDIFVRELELARNAGERLVLSNILYFYAYFLLAINHFEEAKESAEESDRLLKQIGSEGTSVNVLLLGDIAWLEGDAQKARSLYAKAEESQRVLGNKLFTSICMTGLGFLLMEEEDLDGAQVYLEQALVLSRETGRKDFIGKQLLQLSNLFYLQGKREAFRQSVKEGFSLNKYLFTSDKAVFLVTILGSLYFQEPENSSRLLGVINKYEKENYIPFASVVREKRYCVRAEAHARKLLGKAAFEAAFAEGQKMSLDEGLDLALKTVEGM